MARWWWAAVPLLAATAWGFNLRRRPARREEQRELFEGVVYRRQARRWPRPLVIHTMAVDLTAVDFLVTPGDANCGRDVPARTTSAFLREFGLQVAVNGSFFEPFRPGTPWSYYPRAGDGVYILGLAVSQGQAYSQSNHHFSYLCFGDGHAEICRGDRPMNGQQQALAGFQRLVENGQLVRYADQSLHPRTAVGLAEGGKRLWLMVIDGRQWRYSEGVTLAELSELLLELGVEDGLNLDGGGSSTLVVEGARGPRLMNAPIHTYIPLRERPVGNHLGIYARKKEGREEGRG
jgi:hypothetical protein